MRLRKIGGKVIACACLSLSVLMCVPMSAAHAAIPVDTNYAQWDYKPFIYPAKNSDGSEQTKKPDFDGKIKEDKKNENQYFEFEYSDKVSNNALKEYVENDKVTISDLLGLVKAWDREENELTSSIRVAKIEYPASKKDNYKPATVLNPSKTSKLDTYFNHLNKDEYVDIKITYEVSDTGGNTVQQTGYMRVKYNNPPVLKSDYLAYTVEELAERGDEILNEIKTNAFASDIEDDANKIKLTPKLVNPNPLTLNDIKDQGSHIITFTVTDSGGKTATSKPEVYITTGDPYNLANKKTTRFISYKYMYTLKKDSIWRKADRWSYLEKVLKNNESDHPTVKYTYEFTVGDYKD